MPRKPTLSPSRISVYLACPVKYRWSFLDPKGKWFMRSRSYYSFGTTLHRVLQKFHESGGAGASSVDEVMVEYDAAWVSAGYESEQSAEEHRALGRDLLAAYVQKQEERAETPETVVSQTLYVEKQLRKDMGEFVLQGRIDRIDEYSDGSLEIIDYKSGRTEVTEEDVQFDLAMSLYQLLVKHHFPDRRVFATIIALRTGSQASAALTDEQLVEMEADLMTLGHEILNTDYENLLPVFKPVCLGCEFVPLCRKHTDFKEVYDAAEAADEQPDADRNE